MEDLEETSEEEMWKTSMRTSFRRQDSGTVLESTTNRALIGTQLKDIVSTLMNFILV